MTFMEMPVREAVFLIGTSLVQRQSGEERFVRLSDHFDAGIVEDLAHEPARQASGVIAVTGNAGQKFAEHILSGDQQSFRTVHRTGGVRPGIAWYEDGEPIKRVGKDPPHRLGVP